MARAVSQLRFDQGAASRRLLRESQVGQFPRIVTVGGERFVLLRDVFSPEIFWSTRLFSSLLPFWKDQSFLEIGCGAGVTVVAAALHGARHVVAVDINPCAVINTTLNAQLHGVADRVHAMRGDIFDSLDSEERFDAIYWNTPFIWRPNTYRYRNQLERALFDPGYALTARFLGEARERLSDMGRLFIGFANFGDWPRLRILAFKHRYKIDFLGTGTGFEGRRVEFQLLEFVPLERSVRLRRK